MRFSYSAMAAAFTTLSSMSRMSLKLGSSSSSIASSRISITRSPKRIISRKVAGHKQIASCTCMRPSSIRRAISISPSRVNSSTVPISRKYIRTGSSTRITVPNVVVSARSAESSLRKRSLRMAYSPVGARCGSTTSTPISVKRLIIPST